MVPRSKSWNECQHLPSMGEHVRSRACFVGVYLALMIAAVSDMLPQRNPGLCGDPEARLSTS